ncbi:MAG: hypothetical protein KGQ59_04630 [Bdellovibrionales bacterium]|nr:hypothetical protein [Bdellovibrionales bacterium]
MSRLGFHWNPHRVWLAIFGLWFVLLTGVFNRWLGSPGLIQWWRLESLLSQRQAKLVEIENHVLALSTDQVRLERSAIAQQREIRKVLGYVRPDELIFDFSAERSGKRASLGSALSQVAGR